MGKRIIIIDDNPHVRESLGEVLRSQQFDVRIAENGSQGLEFQRESQADLIISDMCMPDKSGIQTIDEIKQEFPSVHVIAISGGPGSEVATGFEVYDQMLNAAKSVGADTTLTKPIRAQALLDAVNELLDD